MAERMSIVTDAQLELRKDWDGLLQRKLNEMEERRAGADPVRLSSAGACQRKLWYKKHHPTLSKGFGTRMIDSFAVGDAVEQIIKFRLNEIYGADYHGFKLVCKGTGAGGKVCGAERKVYSQECLICGSSAFEEFEDQCFLDVPLPDGTIVKVPGRTDGLLKCKDGVIRIVEIKTMANFTFGKIRGNSASGEISYEYACQASAYQDGYGIDETVFLPIRKETGEVAFRIYKKEPELLVEVRKRFVNVILSKPEKPLPRDYGPKASKTAKGALELGFPCGYCEFALACYPTFKLEYIDKKDFGTGSVTTQPVLLDRTGKFKTPEQAQLWEGDE